MVRKYSRQRPEDDPLKKGTGYGTLISSDPTGQPVTVPTEDPQAIYDHVVNGGRAFISFTFEDDNDGYEIYDSSDGRWIHVPANAFTMSPDHVQGLTIDERGVMEFDGFFNEHMVGSGMVKERVRHMEERIGMMGDYTPAGWIVKVRMRIRPEAIDYAHLTIGKAVGVRPRIDWPHGD